MNPNIVVTDNSTYKNTPLYMSVIKRDTERVKLLLKYGADIYLKDENGGESAFEYVRNNINEIKKEIVEMIDRAEEENKKKNR